MKIIHRINDTEIYKVIKNKYSILTLTNNTNLSELLELLDVESTTESSSEIKFTANSVKTLQQFLSDSNNLIDYNVAIKLTLDLVRQILYLEELDETLSYLSVDDIIVIDNSKFIIFNLYNQYSINRDHIQVNKPYKNSSFLPPKMYKNKRLPLKLFYKEVYYSIGTILVYSLFNNQVDEDTNLRELLGSIYATRLYWFIVKCLNPDPRKRQLMYF